eukprot:TRINITY_DN2094_c0_g1_i7.p1 TRINITY_DN2094_c0_g1~~TRINITY_DN2094_c0_g1_i7.p1  ORF type:complete len:265 (+),score=38.60 TRINITY_DN2094_c0_g1_i7:81-875(+)
MDPTRSVVILRHGNRLDHEDPSWRRTAADPEDSPLSVSGHAQASKVARFLRSSEYDVQYIFSSPYTRTLQTATPIAKEFVVPIRVEFGITEHVSEVGSEVNHKPQQHYQVPWDSFPIDREYTSIGTSQEGENDALLHERVMPFIQFLENDSRFSKGTVVLVSHASTVISLVRGFMRDIGLPIFPGTCTITELLYHPERSSWEMRKNCCYAHLHPTGRQFAWGFPQVLQDRIEREFVGYQKFPRPSSPDCLKNTRERAEDEKNAQ